MIGGLEDITSGKIYLDNTFLNDILPRDRKLAMAFQNYALYKYMNVYDNMALGLKLRDLPRTVINTRVKTAAAFLGISDILTKKIRSISDSERQRVALGRAMVRDPAVFLLDEPLSNLDAKLRTQMRTEIIKLHQKLDTTFVYVTHDQTEAMTMASRIVVMKDGFIQQVDTPQNLYDYPANLFVGSFIGSPQMNFFNAKLVKKADGVWAEFGDNAVKVPDAKVRKLVDESYIGKEVVMGIRPENIHDEERFISVADGNLVEAKVEVVELMGSETYLYLKTTGKDGNVVARVDPRSTARNGDTIKVAFETSRLHFFDKDSELSILNR